MAADRKMCEECEVCCGEDKFQYVRDEELPLIMGHVDGNKVLLVCGSDLKVEYDMDFVEGGNDLEADWIQKKFGDQVVLIDYAVHSAERKFICLHEACERRLMKKFMADGMGQREAYEKAHEMANKEEKEFRICCADEEDDDHTAPPHYVKDNHEEVSPEVRHRVATGIAMGGKSAKKGISMNKGSSY